MKPPVPVPMTEYTREAAPVQEEKTEKS